MLGNAFQPTAVPNTFIWDLRIWESGSPPALIFRAAVGGGGLLALGMRVYHIYPAAGSVAPRSSDAVRYENSPEPGHLTAGVYVCM